MAQPMRLRGADRAATAAAAAAAATANAAATSHPFDPFPNPFTGFPLVMTNMAQMWFRPDGTIVLREMRDIGPGLLISKERADALYGDAVVDELKAIFDAVTASNTGERADGAGSASTRLTFTGAESKERKLAKAAAPSTAAAATAPSAANRVRRGARVLGAAIEASIVAESVQAEDAVGLSLPEPIAEA